MSLREDMWKYEQITGESAEHVPIIKLGAFLDGYDMGIKALEQARPKGKWIDNSKEDSYYANCSHCNYQIDPHYERGYLNYCPNCGADMRGDSE